MYGQLSDHLEDAVRLRHELHQNPSLSGQEAPTLERVMAALPAPDQWQPCAQTGAVLCYGPAEKPKVALRSELDALQINENTEVAWASRTEGVMHACGHDTHLAALVAAAHTLRARQASFAVILQPREETLTSGAVDVLASGLLAEYGVQAVIGAHIQPALEEGVISAGGGTINASADEIEILVHGRGGHTAYPHKTKDPVSALAHVIVGLESIIAREIDPVSTAVIAITQLKAGSAANATPEWASARGGVRSLSARGRRELIERARQMAHHTALAHGCRAEVNVKEGQPPLVNDAGLALRATRALQRAGYAATDEFRSAGADDFAYYCERYPSLMMFVGTAAGPSLHSETFLPADSDISVLAGAFIAGYEAAGLGTHDEID